MNPNEFEKFKWTKQRLKAARLVAANDMSRNRIAEEVGVQRSTLDTWNGHPEFKAKVAMYLEEIENQMLRLPIAKRTVRVARLNDLQERLQMVLDDRQTAYMKEEQVIGGRSGAIVKQTKTVGAGKEARVVEEYAFDAALFREIRAIDEQAAKELGQWVDKGELTGKNGSPLLMTEVVIDMSSLGDAPIDDPEDSDESD